MMNKLNIFTLGVFVYSFVVCFTFKKENLGTNNSIIQSSATKLKSNQQLVEIQELLKKFPGIASLKTASNSTETFSK